MGAWGVGMQANDTALDAISEEHIIEQIINKKDEQILQKQLDDIKTNWGDSWPKGVLGLAEYLLDAGVPHTFFRTSRSMIEEAIALEKRKDAIDCWSEPKERQAALNLFSRRLHGKKVDQKALDKTNEGLFSKIGRYLEGVDDEV